MHGSGYKRPTTPEIEKQIQLEKERERQREQAKQQEQEKHHNQQYTGSSIHWSQHPNFNQWSLDDKPEIVKTPGNRPRPNFQSVLTPKPNYQKPNYQSNKPSFGHHSNEPAKQNSNSNSLLAHLSPNRPTFSNGQNPTHSNGHPAPNGNPGDHHTQNPYTQPQISTISPRPPTFSSQIPQPHPAPASGHSQKMPTIEIGGSKFNSVGKQFHSNTYKKYNPSVSNQEKPKSIQPSQPNQESPYLQKMRDFLNGFISNLTGPANQKYKKLSNHHNPANNNKINICDQKCREKLDVIRGKLSPQAISDRMKEAFPSGNSEAEDDGKMHSHHMNSVGDENENGQRHEMLVHDHKKPEETKMLFTFNGNSHTRGASGSHHSSYNTENEPSEGSGDSTVDTEITSRSAPNGLKMNIDDTYKLTEMEGGVKFIEDLD